MLHVGIGDIIVSSKPGEVVKTFALGSCVAMMMYDTNSKIAGMIHIAHPASKISPEKAATLPGYFADTGIPILIKKMQSKGAKKSSTWIKLAGGANVVENITVFDIGRQNILQIKKLLWQRGLGAIKEDIGGKISRTVSLEVDTGEIKIQNNQKIWNL